MNESVQFLFRDAMRKYNNGDASKRAFGVCWISYLYEITGMDTEEYFSDGDKNIYRVKADSRLEAVKFFLSKKAPKAYRDSLPDFKEVCIREMISSIYKYGKIDCLQSSPTLWSFAIDVETVIDGGYYSVDSESSNANDRIEAIAKNVFIDEALEHITPEVFFNVFVEAHLNDVAVVELIDLDADTMQ